MGSVHRATYGNNYVPLLPYQRRTLASDSTESLCNRHFFKTVCSWFEVWMPWQRRVLLCGVTSRCTRQQLEYLTTAMEPVFHRDFVTSLHGLYPTRSMSRKKGNLSRSYICKHYGSTSDVLPSHKGGPVIGHVDVNSLDEYAQTYVQGILQSALERLQSEEHQDTSDYHISQEEVKEKQTMIASVNEDHIDPVKAPSPPPLGKFRPVNKYSFERESQSSRAISKNLTTANILTQPRTVLPPVMEISSTSLLKNGASPERASLSPNRQSFKRLSFHERFGTFPPDNLDQILTHHDLGESNFSVTNLSGKLTPDGTLNQLSSRRLSTFTWCMDHQLIQSCPASKASSARSGNSSHKHRSRSSSLTASTQDFFPSEKLHKLGTYHGVLRTGKVKHPCHVQEIPVSLQKAYKPSRLWDIEQIKKKQYLVRATKSTLKQHFKDQIESVWQWMSKMEDHDKVEFLAELLKKCDQGLLKFFSKCLAKRLEECSNINDLSDKLLLDIFSFLPVDDLNSARLVCRRWYYIASHDELWRLKVLELGASEGIQNLDEMLLDFTKGNSIDWKVAYVELSVVIANAKKLKTPPQQKLLQLKEKLRDFFEYRVREFLDRIRPKHVEDDAESSSSDSPPPQDDMKTERTASGVVELPVTFMATTQSQIDAITGMNEEDKKIQTPQEERDDRKAAAERRAQRRQEMLRGADFALDVRPDPVQAEDLLGKKASAGTDGLHKVYPARNDGIKPIKRVRRLQGHMDAVCTLMFDKRRIVTGSMDHSIRVWDIRSGRSIKKIYGHLGGIRCLQFSEKYIVSGSWDMSVRVWDIIRFTEVAVMTGHSGVVSCLQFNSKYLVTGSHDKSLRVWSMDDFSCRSILKHHSSAVTCLVFHDQFVVSGSTDRTVKISDVETGECVMSYTDASEPISAVHVQGDLILGATVAGQLFCWKKDSGETVAGLQLTGTPIFKILFTPDTSFGPRFLLGLGDGSIQEWDLVTMTCLRALYGHKGPVRDVQSSSDRIVSCSDDGNVRIWDLMPPPLRVGDKADKDTIETTTIHQRRDS